MKKETAAPVYLIVADITRPHVESAARAMGCPGESTWTQTVGEFLLAALRYADAENFKAQVVANQRLIERYR